MVGVVNIPQAPLVHLRPTSVVHKSWVKKMSSIRATSSPSSSSSSSSSSKNQTFSAPPNFKPPEPKRFAVRPDKTLDLLGASLAIFFRFGTGLFVNGYSVSLVSANEIPPNQYALEAFGTTYPIQSNPIIRPAFYFTTLLITKQKLFTQSCAKCFKVKETSKLGPCPEKPIEIYEFEGCPFCRKVREIVAVLDLDVLYYPCPQNGPNFRPKAIQMGGKRQFPYMVDPNTGVSMYESDEIIKYLVGKYGDGTVPIMLSLGLLTTLTAGFAMIGRAGKGSSYTPSKLPPQPLELWAYEGSPFCKLVRETLVELELPHIQRSCARGSPKRQIMFEKMGRFQVPYLEDPNTGVQMFESAAIIDYLRAVYAA